MRNLKFKEANVTFKTDVDLIKETLSQEVIFTKTSRPRSRSSQEEG